MVEGEQTNRRSRKAIKVVVGVFGVVTVIGMIGSAFEDDESAGDTAATEVSAVANDTPATTEPAVPTATPTSPVDERIDVSSGRPLSEFEGADSYPWRARLVRNSDRMLAELAATHEGLGRRSDVTDVLSTCSDLVRLPGQDAEATRVLNAISRFENTSSSSPTGPISPREAREIISVATRYACPGLR